MTIINLSRVRSNFGVKVYRDSNLVSEISQVEFLTPTSSVVWFNRLKGYQVSKVYEFVIDAWVERTDVRVKRLKLLFDTEPVGTILVVPVSNLSVVQTNIKVSNAIEVFIKTYPEFDTKNVTITTLDNETAAAGPFQFSATEDGTYTDSINFQTPPASFWIKTSLATVGSVYTIPLVITSDLYL